MGIFGRCKSYFAGQSISRLLTFHFVICFAGLIVISMFFAGLLARAVHLPEHLVADLYPWAKNRAGTGKIISLLQYVIPVLMMFIYFPLVTFLTKWLVADGSRYRGDNFPRVWDFYLVLITTNVGLLIANKERLALLGVLSVLWLLLFLWFPLSVHLNRWLTRPTWFVSWIAAKVKWFWGIAICLVLIHYVTIFVPMIVGPLMIGQDYVHVSSRTILSDGKVVDNLDYINEHKINNLQIYDPRKSTAGTMVKVDDCRVFQQTLALFNRELVTDYDCEVKTNILTARLPFMSLEEDAFKYLRIESVSDEEKDFIRLNTEGDLENQKKKGWFFFHHGYNFGPMNALSLGAAPDKQTMVYGWLSTVTQGRVLESLGMMNYQGYFKAFFSNYLIYFMVYMLGIWLIYKDPGTVAFAGLLAVSALLFLGTELIRLGPGFNPMRHFFDVPAFYLLYRYLSDKRNIYLFAATALALFAILWSKDFGAYLSLSIGGALFVYGLRVRPFQRLPLIIGLLTVVSALSLYLYPMPGANPTSIYMLLGVGSPLAAPKEIFNLILLVGVLLLCTLWVRQDAVYKTLTIGMALYFVQSLTYFIWYPEWHHLWGVAPVFILWMTALYHGMTSCQRDRNAVVTLQVPVFVLLLLLIYVPAYAHFSKERKAYTQQFEHHQLYQWNFARGSFASTMDPSLFEGAVALIDQYSADKGIYIISKYDHILPVLAGRYSAMPYNEVMTNMASAKEVDVAAKAILENKPQYLFVDSDIGHIFIENVKKSDSAAHLAVQQVQAFYGEAVARERLLGQLNDVYLKVADKYVKCKSGGLISVYCRKPD